MNIQKAVLVVLVGVATGALAFGVACGGSDEPPEQDSRSQDDRRAERSEQPTQSISDGSPSSQASSGSGSSVDPTASPTNPFEATYPSGGNSSGGKRWQLQRWQLQRWQPQP